MRAERIELSSLAWKAGILAIIRRPRVFKLYQIVAYNRKRYQEESSCIQQKYIMINKFTNNLDDDSLHSNGFAEVSANSSISGRPQTFNERMHIEKNRSTIRRYHESTMGRGHHHSNPYARVDLRPAGSSAEPNTPQQQSGATRPVRGQRPVRSNGLISDIKPMSSPSRFSEPPTRGFNPYK